ncbi:uncharacterized protein PHALS_02850 [Plasmopara halstedii]|uniref:Uncharacterized protein n=1 Tax=Plasmopara halstedii TaxID=4781 RepID=A0A0P1AYV6_PLAHL|nr:uncharacterized protein PHALS_02850 [Plasmopara halstedii]CEG46449.1 hypothetical protein PHALS_02850 [Plasmopara halstedii]|eukprot:XP_024582818.1 hypothetical protein PHALS_02850 [Plasmopara halstedii]
MGKTSQMDRTGYVWIDGSSISLKIVTISFYSLTKTPPNLQRHLSHAMVRLAMELRLELMKI